MLRCAFALNTCIAAGAAYSIYDPGRVLTQMSVEAVKAKLSTHCGTSAGEMQLQLLDESKSPVATLTDDRRLLGYYSPSDG